MHSSLRNSDKLNVVDYSTFAQIQQHSSSSQNGPVRKIRNAKYRKKHQNADNDFDLLALIAASNIKKAPKQRAHHKKGATLLQQMRTIKKGGKSRETRKKNLTRLKKSIMKNRELKDRQAHLLEKEPKTAEISSNFLIEQQPKATERMKMNLKKFTSISSEEDSVYHDQPQSLDPPTDQMCKMSLLDSSPKPLKTIHSRRFREYCDNCTTKELAALTKELLSDLSRFQKRAFQKNPIKANAHRRIVLGFREVQNNLRINKIKLVLIATDCEKCNMEGGIDDEIDSIKAECKSMEIPYAFPLQRRQLANVLKKNGSISCVGILDYDGARDKFVQLIVELENARAKYANSAERI